MKSWESINVLLVLFAIVCGILARWNRDVGSSTNKELEIPVVEVLNEIPLQQTSSPTSSYELRWYELSYESQMHTKASGSCGLRRNSSSYPDLRQQSDWETTSSHEFRYYDDFEISRFNQSIEVQPNGTVSGRGITRRNGDSDKNVIAVDTFPDQPDSAAKSLQDNPPSQPPHPPPTTKQKKTRVHRSDSKRERSGTVNAPRAAPHQQPKKEDKGSSTPIKNGLMSQTKPLRRKVHRDVSMKDATDPKPASESSSNPIPSKPSRLVHLTIPMEEEYLKPTDEISSPLNLSEPLKLTTTAQKQGIEIKAETKASQPPSPPPTPIRPDQNQKIILRDKKKNSAKKEIAMVWASIYKRKKKQDQHGQQQQLGRADSGNFNGKSQHFSEPEYTSSSQLFPPTSPAPPPPPPPPPHSVFHSLLKKSGTSKRKKIHSVAAPPPPRQSFSPTDNSPPSRTSTGGKPPLPKRPSSYSKSEHRGYLNNSGSKSPQFDIPRPPPLPPFGVPDTKFVVRGDYAKIKSNASSQSGSPEPYVFGDDDESLINESVNEEAKRLTTPYCPSPDVNAKADTFIARLRGEWRLENMNSVNEKTTRMGI